MGEGDTGSIVVHPDACPGGICNIDILGTPTQSRLAVDALHLRAGAVDRRRVRGARRSQLSHRKRKGTETSVRSSRRKAVSRPPRYAPVSTFTVFPWISARSCGVCP